MSDTHNAGSYSRELGSASYRSRRRRNRVLKVVVALALLTVIGGASYMFGKQFLDADKIPFDLPGVESASETAQTSEGGVGGESEAPVTVQPASATVVAAGDVIVDGAVTESGKRESGAYDFDHLFKHVKGELDQFDLRIVSQETGLAGRQFGFGANFPLNAPQDLGRAEQKAGFNVILRASDHALDSGEEGIHNELEWWYDTFADMPVLGIADADPEGNPTLSDYVSQVYVYDKGGFRIAVLNHSAGIEGNGQKVVSPLTEAKIAEDVRKAREQDADMIIACPHWGDEGSSELSDEQKHFAEIYTNEGVDVILGSNPRVLQEVEVLEGKDGHKTVCFYSLGCFVSSLSDNSLLGGLAEVQLDRNDKGDCFVSKAVLKPVITHRGNADDYGTYLLKDYDEETAWSGWDGWVGLDEWNRRCTEVLGDGFDPESCECVINLDEVGSTRDKDDSEQKDEDSNEEQSQDEWQEW